MNSIAILQSNYLPWKGVFDMIHCVDEFVFLEDVQYTEHDWRNRNKIMTADGVKWITVPVKNSNRRGQLICEAEIDNRYNWQRKHYNSFLINYGKAPYFKDYKWIIEEIYINNRWMSLSDLNIFSIKLISEVLGLKKVFRNSIEIGVQGVKDDRIIDICKKLKADKYISGPAAIDYIKPQKFVENAICLEYMNYIYPAYKQLHEPFCHNVTVLDVIFNCGKDAQYYIWGWKEGATHD